MPIGNRIIAKMVCMPCVFVKNGNVCGTHIIIEIIESVTAKAEGPFMILFGILLFMQILYNISRCF